MTAVPNRGNSSLEGNPYAVIEGMMIAGYAIGASEGYFYVRAEYPIVVNCLRNAIRRMNEIGILGENILGTGVSFQAHIRLGAGAFVCGMCARQWRSPRRIISLPARRNLP